MAQYRQIDDNFVLGPQPTKGDLEEARQQGIKTVIDLRQPTETASPNAEPVREAGLDYVNIPVNRAALSTGHVDELEAALTQRPGPYLVHCATGARAALMLVLVRARQQGWTAQRAFDEAEAMGFNLRNSEEFANFVRLATGE